MRRPDVNLTILGPHRPRPNILRRIRRRFAARKVSPMDFDPTGQSATIGIVASGLIDVIQKPGLPPLYHVTDATPKFLNDYYEHDVNHDIHAREARVIAAARRVIYSSDYMAQRAATEFGLSPDALAVVPFGINFDTIPGAPAKKATPAPLKLLFVGTKWHRKGGPIVLDAFRALLDRGIPAELTLVGEPPDQPVPNGVTVVGYLNKNVPAEAARLTALFEAAHIFVLPTRADCTPMVVAEANVYGVPVLVTETGGIGSLVENGINGQMLPMAAGGADWADAIEAMVPNLDALNKSSHAHASTYLTWDRWAGQLVDILRQDLQKVG